MMDIQQVHVPEETVLTKTCAHIRVEQLPALIGPTFMAMAAHIDAQGVAVAGEPYVKYLGIDENAQLNPLDMTVEIGFPISAAPTDAGEFECCHRGAFEGVRVTYTGDYDAGMEAVYKDMLGWMAQHQKPFAGVSYEVYRTGEETPMDHQVTVITMPFVDGVYQ